MKLSRTLQVISLLGHGALTLASAEHYKIGHHSISALHPVIKLKRGLDEGNHDTAMSMAHE